MRAFQRFGLFSAVTCTLIDVGEEMGALDEALLEAAQLREEELALQQQKEG